MQLEYIYIHSWHTDIKKGMWQLVSPPQFLPKSSHSTGHCFIVFCFLFSLFLLLSGFWFFFFWLFLFATSLSLSFLFYCLFAGLVSSFFSYWLKIYRLESKTFVRRDVNTNIANIFRQPVFQSEIVDNDGITIDVQIKGKSHIGHIVC